MRRLITSFAIALCAIALDASENADATSEAAADTIAFINHINYVVETIRSYNNVIVLEQEYKKMSVDSINLNKIPDEEVLGWIVTMLDTLKEMRMDERQRSRAQYVLEKSLNKKLVDNFLKGSIGGVINGVKSSATGVIPGLFTAVDSVLSQSIDTFIEYKNIQKTISEANEEEQFKLDTKKLEKLHELNVSLLKAEWGMIRKYKLDDALRISGENVRKLVDCLKDAERRRIYRRMIPMEQVFAVYPTYWYYRTMLAIENENMPDAIRAAEHFEKVNRGLFRSDLMAASVKMGKITAQIAEGKIDKESFAEDISLICAQNYDSVNTDMGLFCAMVYNDYLENPEAARKVLAPVKDLLESEVENSYVEYCDLLTRPKEQRKDAHLSTKGINLVRCRMLWTDINEKLGRTADVEILKKVCRRDTTCSLEKLFYFGRLRMKDLWPVIEEDVWAINICESSASGKNRIEFEIPLKWFALDEMSISVALYAGEKGLWKGQGDFANFGACFSKPCWRSGNASMPYVSAGANVDASICKKADKFVLELKHPVLPVVIEYKRVVDSKGGWYKPVRVSKFMGKPFEGLAPDVVADHRRITTSWAGSTGAGASNNTAKKRQCLRDFILKEFDEVQDFGEIFVHPNLPKDKLAKVMKQLGVVVPESDVLVWAWHKVYLGCDEHVMITGDKLYFTAIANVFTGGVIGKDYAKHGKNLYSLPSISGNLTEINVGGKISMVSARDSKVSGILYEAGGARSKEEGMANTFGAKFIAKLQATIAKAKELNGK